MKVLRNNKGFTLLEIVIGMAIGIGIMVLITYLIGDLSEQNLRFTQTLTGQESAQQTLQVMIPEIRSAAPSNIGNYPIEQAGTSTLIFYSDTNGDGFLERIRYYLSGDVFNKGVIKPTGNPLEYNSNNEKSYSLVSSIVNGDSPIFSYYGANATSSQSAPLSQPVDINSVRMIKVSLIFNQGDEYNPNIVGIENQATIRNLRFQ
ncbi:MAG: hypothetical protein COU09_01055 [Candidatus Harrisonbacteria bacterium CG10_big_fil_rev_8_21_14_0_10_44_23]|uniref:Prepilin-type N-terminal cleavage/methylation domain-containing protein n=1 Tax=Candidatus Harrisonbacteria bacterium CG10_big_fil_rev_8_21_14_0_10_44_23 TaxID=1974585 RepID=A0A2H0UQJ2_9BACT|nr:MAG: hypothetical protein COU09_01055 [Candidatus Harrisonbacteria bacterium CG10_big_fil_rev_8_21_14_0_10_44_23]